MREEGKEKGREKVCTMFNFRDARRERGGFALLCLTLLCFAAAWKSYTYSLIDGHDLEMFAFRVWFVKEEAENESARAMIIRMLDLVSSLLSTQDHHCVLFEKANRSDHHPFMCSSLYASSSSSSPSEPSSCSSSED